MKNFSSLSSNCQQIILGSLLGDGHIRLDKSYNNARFSVRHSEKYIDYFNWKIENLVEIESKKSIHRQLSMSGSKSIKFQSRAVESITDIFKMSSQKSRFYIRRKFLNKLNPLGLCVWWLDDGSLISNTRKGVICSESFTYDEHLLLVRYLRNVWKINPKIVETVNGTFRLYFSSVEELKKFLTIIIPYIPVKCMLYKVIILYKDLNLQQRWISEIVEKSIFNRDDVEEIVEKRKQQLKHFRK